jgi:hypothetical protein
MRKQSYADSAVGWRFVAVAIIFLLATFAFQAFAEEVTTEEITSEETIVSEAVSLDVFVSEEDLTPPSIVLLEGEESSSSEVTAIEEIATEEAVEETVGESESSTVVISQDPELMTDKEEYAPEETATVLGRFFSPLKTIFLRFVAGPLDGSEVYFEDEAEVTTDETGGFTYDYQLSDLFAPLYRIFAQDEEGNQLAETSFIDPLKTDFSQCSNNNPTAGTCTWIGSIIQQSNSVYYEGMTVPQRILFTDAKVVNGAHTITFSYQYTKAGIHAYDFLTTVNPKLGIAQGNSSFTPGTPNLAACADFSGPDLTACNTLNPTVSNPQQIVIPNDSFDSKDATPAGQTNKENAYEAMTGMDRYISAYVDGGTATFGTPTLVHDPVGANSDTSDSEVQVTIPFTTSGCNVGNGCDILLYFGGHLAVTGDGTSESWGPGLGSSQISGGPYHIKSVQFDGTGGSQDNQIKGADILLPPEPGKIIVVKQTTPDGNNTQFTFNPSWSAQDFTLSDGQQNDSGDLDAGVYSVSEIVPSGWTQTSATCSDGSPIGAIDVAEGETVTCTFENTLQQGTLTLVKTVTNDNGGTAATTDWTLSASGPTQISGTTGSGSVTNAAVNAGTYTLSESTGPAGYTAGSWECTGATVNGNQVTVPAGGNVICTINNNDNAPSLTLVKEVINDNGGTATVADFTLTADGTGANDISGTSPVDSGAGLKVDTFALSETNLPGYTASAWSCVGGTQNGSSITLGLGEEATCTITNDDQQSYITVTKVVNNDYGGTAEPDDFNLKLEDNDVSSGVQVPVNPGTYTASETPLPGYSFIGFSGDCDGNGDVTVALGESKTCTLTNSDIQPKLKLIKTVNNQYGGTAGVDDFQASISGTDVDWNVFIGLSAGNYDANETNLNGYQASSWGGDCAGDGAVTINIGETKTCNITNSDLPASISGMKFEDMNGNGIKDAGDNGLSGWTIFLDTNGDGDLDGSEPSTTTVGDGSYTFTGLSVGIYKVREVQQAGWTQTTSNPSDVELSNGEDVTSVDFGNFKLVLITGKKFNDDEGDGSIAGDATLSNWTIRLYDTSTNPWTLVDTQVTDGTGTYTFNGLSVGSYKVCEVLQTGWVQTFASIQGTNTSPNSANEGQWCNTKNVTISGSNPSAGNFGNYQIKALEVSKTAETTFTRTHKWEITKSVDDDSVDIFTGDSQTVNYDVEVTKTGSMDSAWAVSGNITITNPNPVSTGLTANITDIVDTISGQGDVLVTCPGGLAQDLAPGATLNCTYTKAVTDGNDELNTVTVSTSGLVPGGEGTANVDFEEPTTVINDKINITDTYEGDLGETNISTTFEYDRVLTCGAGEGKFKGLGNNVPNTATITETNQSADEYVTVNCYDLTVTKDASTSYTKTWTWDIDKTSTTTTLNLAPGQIHPVYYEVTVSATSQNSDYAAAGTITITNPAPIAAPITGVTDILTGNIAAIVDCKGATSIPANGSLECTYEVDLANADTLTNTAEVTMTNGTKYSGTAQVNFASAVVTEVDESIEVTDDKKGVLGTVLATDTLPKTFKYVLNVGPYEGETVCGTTQKFDNTAELTTNDTDTSDTDTVTVNANIRCTCSLTQGYWKTHNDTFHGGAPTDDNWENVAPNGELTGFFTTNPLNTYPYLGLNAPSFTWYTVFWTAPKGNVYYNMAHQYMAAKLNVLNGAYNPTINADIAAAEALLKLYTPNAIATMKGKNATNISKQFQDLAGKFAAFNEGTTNPAGHCTEIPQ